MTTTNQQTVGDGGRRRQDDETVEMCRRCEDEPANAGYGYCEDCVNECGAQAMDRLDY